MKENEPKDFNEFFTENKKLAKEYVDTRVEILKLEAIRIFSKSAGVFIWALVMLMVFFLLLVFLGLVTGFWMSEITGSYTYGFAIATGILVIVAIMITLLRKVLFVNPVIRNIINKSK